MIEDNAYFHKKLGNWISDFLTLIELVSYLWIIIKEHMLFENSAISLAWVTSYLIYFIHIYWWYRCLLINKQNLKIFLTIILEKKRHSKRMWSLASLAIKNLKTNEIGKVLGYFRSILLMLEIMQIKNERLAKLHLLCHYVRLARL